MTVTNTLYLGRTHTFNISAGGPAAASLVGEKSPKAPPFYVPPKANTGNPMLGLSAKRGKTEKNTHKKLKTTHSPARGRTISPYHELWGATGPSECEPKSSQCSRTAGQLMSTQTESTAVSRTVFFLSILKVFFLNFLDALPRLLYVRVAG